MRQLNEDWFAFDDSLGLYLVVRSMLDLVSGSDPEAVTRRLVRLAIGRGGDDNITAVVIVAELARSDGACCGGEGASWVSPADITGLVLAAGSLL